MRYVDLQKLMLPPGWIAQATQAAADVASGAATPDEHSAVWRALKDNLASLLHDKCWYCETPVDRSDNAVDHFRPKGRVADATHAHTGYRWLAFDRTNFRYACTYCNSRRKGIEDKTVGGKADRFPLLDESARVYLPGDCSQEHPTLLDPCDLDDWRLLGCKQENGQPCGTGTDAIERERAEVSIEVYHLHHEPTCKRRHSVAVELMAAVDEGKRLFERLKVRADLQFEFKNVARRIKRSIDREAQFSGDMHFLLRGQRHSDHPWIQDLLEA
jgi:hypothetical protein